MWTLMLIAATTVNLQTQEYTSHVKYSEPMKTRSECIARLESVAPKLARDVVAVCLPVKRGTSS